MISSAFVNLWGNRVGAVSWNDSTGTGYFEYEPSFTRLRLDISPIKMPVANANNRVFSFGELSASKSFRGLPGLLADMLPDKFGSALIDAWLARNGRQPGSLNPIEILCFTGKRGMGALEIEPAFPRGAGKAEHIELSDLVSVANKILSGRMDFTAKLPPGKEKAISDILKMGSSPAGARAKVLIAYNEGTGEVRSGQVDAPKGFSHWLLKFDGVKDNEIGVSNGFGKVELAYHRMALDCEIEMTECRLLEENGRAHFMTRRFDRDPDNGKIHMQSFFALRHFDFSDVNLYGYEQLFETMRMLGLPYPQAEQLFRRMTFNVLARNCDDHTKNFAFLMDRNGRWRLSPAYDVCHSYRPDSIWVGQQSLSVNGKRKNITKDDILSVATQMNIKKAPAIIEKINTVVTNWNKYANDTGVSKKLRDAIGSTLIRY
jgi:serine/threonine-protein kinase HipA